MRPSKFSPLWHARCKKIDQTFTLFTGFTDIPAMVSKKSSQQGLKDGWTRATFILRKDHLEKIKSVSYWERKKIKEVVDEALTLYFEEKKARRKTNR